MFGSVWIFYSVFATLNPRAARPEPRRDGSVLRSSRFAVLLLLAICFSTHFEVLHRRTIKKKKVQKMALIRPLLRNDHYLISPRWQRFPHRHNYSFSITLCCVAHFSNASASYFTCHHRCAVTFRDLQVCCFFRARWLFWPSRWRSYHSPSY